MRRVQGIPKGRQLRETSSAWFFTIYAHKCNTVRETTRFVGIIREGICVYKSEEEKTTYIKRPSA